MRVFSGNLPSLGVIRCGDSSRATGDVEGVWGLPAVSKIVLEVGVHVWRRDICAIGHGISCWGIPIIAKVTHKVGLHGRCVKTLAVLVLVAIDGHPFNCPFGGAGSAINVNYFRDSTCPGLTSDHPS